MTKRKDAIKGLNKWEEFRVRRENTIRAYVKMKKRVEVGRKWLWWI
jgi:hypothetical protein